MIEDSIVKWINADDFSCDSILGDTDKMLNANLVLSEDTTANKVIEIIKILRSKKYGFEKSFCKITIHSSPIISQEIINALSQCDEYLPQILVNIIVNDKDFIFENIVSKLHMVYKKLSAAKMDQEYTFVLSADMTYAKRMLYIMGRFKELIASYDNHNVIEVKCDVSPKLISLSGTSFTIAQSEMDNIIYGIIDELPEVAPSRTCGMVSIVYYIALIKEMQYKYDGIDVWECLRRSIAHNSCYYGCNGNSVTCLECIKNYLELMPKDLGQSSVFAKEFLREKKEVDELKILEADWDYIV